MARILLIEDSPTDTAVLTQLLERNGHWVLSSGSAEDGIEVCKRELPDLVLMDVVLPGMNGFQATRALSRDGATGNIPVLIVSTKGMETDKAWGMRQGARDYIVKPPDEGALIRSEAHTSELQSLMRISYAVLCLKIKRTHRNGHAGAESWTD